MREWTIQEWTIRHHVARVDFAGVDKSARCGNGGHCRSGQCNTMWQGWTMQEWTYRHGVAREDNAGVDNAGVLKQERQVEMCAHTAALNDHLLGASDDDDGADEDAAQTTDQTPPQDAAVTSEPATRASDDCCEVCLINCKDPPIDLVPLRTSAFRRVVRGDVASAWGQMSTLQG